MKGRAKSSNDLKKDCSEVGVRGRMNVSVTVYNKANVPKVATCQKRALRRRSGNRKLADTPFFQRYTVVVSWTQVRLHQPSMEETY
jgi:hypothetical protein